MTTLMISSHVGLGQWF